MDAVDDFQAHLVSLSELDVSDSNKAVLEGVSRLFELRDTRYLFIARGKSAATKVIIKPRGFFPLFAKVATTQEIETEAAGDRLIRNRVPPLSIPPLFGTHYENAFGAIVYRYVTGGRVRDLVRRFDTALPHISTYEALSIIDDIFDVVLKKCHWLDGDYVLREIVLPALPENLHPDDARWNDLVNVYERARAKCRTLKAPHGITHDDLHPKNVLLTRDNSPVLIDFFKTSSNRCHYFDFAKLEVYLQFQIEDVLSQEFWRIPSLMYGPTPLIIPHSHRKLASVIHHIRSNLWQGCTRLSLGMDSEEIDLGYRGFLLYFFTRIFGLTDFPAANRTIAYQQAALLGEAFR